MNSLLKTITASLITLLITACASTDPNAPVDDDYLTSNSWNKHRSKALNLLITANMANKYNDVSSKEDVADIRDRNTTFGNLFGNIMNLAAFDFGMMLYSVNQNDDDKDPRFSQATYVSYIPVDSDDLTPHEQLNVRLQAVSNVEKTLFALGSDQSKFVALPKKNNRVLYRTKVNGEACEATKFAYDGSGFLPCHLTVKPTIVKVFETEDLPDYLSNNIKTQYVASVTLTLTNPLVAVIMAKGIQGNDFVALPDFFGHSGFKFVTSTPVVIQNKTINSFFKPRKNVAHYEDNEVYLGIYFKKSKRRFSMPIITSGDSVLTEFFDKN